MKDPGNPRLHHVAALDGLRGVAVLAVVLFHANWLTGGWVGVDVFFVLSGYLITRLLLVERESGRISLAAFWGRRFRRLMPALLCLILAVAIAERWRGRLSGAAGARWDIAGALTYLSNWFRLRDGVGYWSNFGGVSLLDHVWSLAIEEQFYVVWPLIMVAVTWRSSRASRPLLIGLWVATVALGAWSLWWFARTGDANRVYLGTDTRAVAIVLGAAVGTLHQRIGDKRRPLDLAVGLASGAFLVWAFIDLGGLELRTYRGGLLLCSAAAGALVWSVTGTKNPLATVLSAAPLRWLGSRSYGIYLWHWPVMVAAQVAKVEASSNARRLAALAVTAAVAELSYRLVESPIRRRGLAAFGIGRRRMMGAGAAIVVASVAIVALPATSQDAVIATAGEPLVIPTVPADLAAEVDEPLPTAGPTDVIAAPVPLPASRPARVMIVGDSFGWFFGNTLFDTQRSLGIEVEVQAIPSCPPTSVDIAQRRSEGEATTRFDEACRTTIARYRADIARFKPDVVLMMFGGTLFGEYEVGPGTWSDACGEAFGPWFIDQVTGLVRDLGSSGATVMVMTEANYREPTVPDDYLTLDARTACKNNLWPKAVEASESAGDRVGLVRLGEWICPVPGACLDRRQGIELRPDGVHLQDWSAILAWQWMAPQLFEPAPQLLTG